MKITIVSLFFITACSPSQLDQAKSVAKDVWEVARVLCIRAHAEQAGVSVQDVTDTVCATQAELEPWVQPILDAQKAGLK